MGKSKSLSFFDVMPVDPDSNNTVNLLKTGGIIY